MLRSEVVGPLVLALSLPAVVQARTPIEEFLENVEAGGTYEPGSVALKVDPALSLAAVKALVRSQGCEWDHQWGRHPWHTVNCDEERDMAGLIRSFSAKPGVVWVEAGFYDEEELAPNDLFNLQWYHDNTGQAVDMVNGTPGADLGSLDAWEVSTGSPQRVIAIVDIGIYLGHQDLAPQTWTNPGEVCGNGRDDDNNGYIDDCNGWDIGGNDPDASPLTLPTMQNDGDPCLRWHATYIAGLAAAQGNNNLGLAGGSWDASLMNLKRHRDSSCTGTSARSAEATRYAVDNGADVLGYSFNSTTNSTAFREALAAADAAGVIAVMSAGNSGRNINSSTRYPNNYPMTNKIIAASSNNRDQLDPASNYGSSKVDIAMPGTYVVSTAIDNPMAYGVGSGTSMAVGFGLAAVSLGKTAFPTASSSQILQAILQGGEAVPALSCANSSSRCVRTGRRLDYLGMMQQLRPLSPANLSLGAVTASEIGNQDGRFGPGERVVSGFTVSNAGPGGAYGLRGSLRVISGPGLTPQNPTLSFGSVPSGQNLTPNRYVPFLEVANNCNTDFDAQIELTVTDVLGNTAATNWTVPIRCMGAPPPPDAGFPDSGAGAPDATQPPADGGATPADGGVLPRDSGVLPRDSGVLPRDSGVFKDAANSDPDPNEDPFVREPSGCTATPRAPFALWMLLGLGLLRRRR